MKNVAEFVWKRHQSHWNWIIMICSLAVFLMALWWHSVILSFLTVVGTGCSLLKLSSPEPPFDRVEKILDYERKWLKSPWGWKKGLQLFGMVASFVYVCVACWEASVMALLLFVGICVNIACVYGNKAMGVDDL